MGQCVAVHGQWISSKQEICADKIELLSDQSSVLDTLHNSEMTDAVAVSLRQSLHLRCRNQDFAQIIKLRSLMTTFARDFLVKHHFWEVQPPSLTTSECELASKSCDAEYSDASSNIQDQTDDVTGSSLITNISKDPPSTAFLSASSQLHLQAAACGSLGRVYSFCNVWRGENHQTARHLMEFSMLEVELAFVDDIHQLLDLCEALVRHIASSLLQLAALDHTDSNSSSTIYDARESELNYTNKSGVKKSEHIHVILADRVKTILNTPIVRMSYDQAVQQLGIPWGKDLSTENEKKLTEQLGPVFVHSYPSKIKAFYMLPQNDGVCASFDLLLPHSMLEVAGGGLRQHRARDLCQQMKEMDLAKYQWYIEMIEMTSTPHGGFGIGFDRLVAYFTGRSNIRDVVLFPRSQGSRLQC